VLGDKSQSSRSYFEIFISCLILFVLSVFTLSIIGMGIFSSKSKKKSANKGTNSTTHGNTNNTNQVLPVPEVRDSPPRQDSNSPQAEPEKNNRPVC
jgi:hypothetical protein